MIRPPVRAGVTGVLPLLLMMAAGSLAQPAQKSPMILERSLARVTARPPFIVFPPAHDATVAAPLRLMLPSGPIVIPRIAMSQNGNASVDWSSRVDPIRLDTSPIEDPTKAIMVARCPRRVDPFPLFGAETRPVATFPDRLPSASLPASPLAPAPPPTAAPSAIDITSTLRIRFTPAGPRCITLSAPALTTPRSIVRPPW